METYNLFRQTKRHVPTCDVTAIIDIQPTKAQLYHADLSRRYLDMYILQ
jgi:hypothetical protein